MNHPIVVLAGGLSHEREVSLASGRRVAAELRALGREVVESDVDANLMDLLAGLDRPVVLPVLHGGTGEDGALREALDLIAAPYVGSDATACRLTFDKALATPVVVRAGVTAPRRVVLPHDLFRELGAGRIVDQIVARLGLPLFVKPAVSGSALGCSRVDQAAALPQAMVNAYNYGRVAVIEQFVVGTEVAVAVIDVGAGPRAYPPVEIRPDSGVYDWEARYTPGATSFVCPADLPDPVLDQCRAAALTAYEALRQRDYARMDLIVDPGGRPVFLEANVAPGLTETSTGPRAVEAAGASLGEVFGQLADQAARRGYPA
ncbi:MAG: D-alanine--D-alanine ligase [Propionibacteriaceae bacterium]|jgi:D-alanine-D-alanine ligase|nr:D-alanine--D-alanine ligase [Propionibacteriaceae bacterium]